MTAKAYESLWREARKLGRHMAKGKGPPPLLFFTDPSRTPDPSRVLRRMPPGSGLVYRAFGADDAESVGRRLASLARRKGVVFFVGADIGLAVRLRADGIHLPERQSRRAGDNQRLGKRFILTAAAHDLPAVLRSARANIAAIVCSAIFTSNSPSAGAPIGTRRLATMVRACALPVLALGGVKASTIGRLRHTGVVGAAAIGGLIEIELQAEPGSASRT